jgi:5-dehydro-2-deoxygluconokinase
VTVAGCSNSPGPTSAGSRPHRHLFAAERARRWRRGGLDLDFRPDQWHDPLAFGVAAQSALRLVDIVIGTEDEIRAAVLSDPMHVERTHSVSDTKVQGDVGEAVRVLLSLGPGRY